MCRVLDIAALPASTSGLAMTLLRPDHTGKEEVIDMRGLNRSILAGRLVADPEVRYTQNETAVTHFRLAINWQNKNGKGVDFINCVAWGSLAKICGEYLKKGRLVAVEGRLQIKNYKDKQGQNRTSTEVVVDNMQMLDSKFFNAANKAGTNNEEEMIEV